MLPTNALAMLENMGLEISTVHDKLAVKPRARITAEAREIIRTHRDGLVLLLRTACPVFKRSPKRQPPGPADIAEGAAIIAEGDHCDRVTADGKVLAAAHRELVLADLARLPPASSNHGCRLLEGTRAFLDSTHWQAAVALGWELVDLFGVHPAAPLARFDGQGLVPLLALSRLPGLRLETIGPAGAVFCTRSGARQSYALGKPATTAAVLWWECEAIWRHDYQEPNKGAA